MKKHSTVSVQYNKDNSIAFLIRHVVEAWTAVRKQGGTGSWESVVEPYLYYDWNLGRILVLASQTVGYFPLEQKTI